jgi:hypothetical protein
VKLHLCSLVSARLARLLVLLKLGRNYVQLSNAGTRVWLVGDCSGLSELMAAAGVVILRWPTSTSALKT